MKALYWTYSNNIIVTTKYNYNNVKYKNERIKKKYIPKRYTYEKRILNNHKKIVTLELVNKGCGVKFSIPTKDGKVERN